ncbi:MAG: putative bifunctional diguanylate cyclase/phosphodiesterase [Leptospirillum sp.]
MGRIAGLFPLLRLILLGLFILFPAYFLLYKVHLKAERKQQIILQQWSRADFDLLSLSRMLRVIPLSSFLFSKPLRPDEVRLIQGWAIQGQVALLDLDKFRPLFSHFQREELDRLETSFQFLKDFLKVSMGPSFQINLSGKEKAETSFFAIWSLERKLGMTMTVFSLSVRTSRGEAEKALEHLETTWERIYLGILMGFLLILLGMEAWKLKRARGAIFSKEAQLQAVFNAMRDAVLYADLERRIQFANPAVEEVFGYRPSELIGRSTSILYARKEDFDQQGQLRYHSSASDASEPYEMTYIRADGSSFIGEASGAVVRDPAGRAKGFMVTVKDITQRKEMMDHLFLEKEKWFVTLGSIGDAVIVTDSSARVEYLNSIAEKLTGWTGSEATGRPIREVFDIINEMTRSPAENPVEKSLRLGSIVGLANHTILRCRSGVEYGIEDSAAPIQNRAGEVIGCVIVFRDVTHKRNLLHQVTHQATHDALTDLPNRLLFQDRLNQMLVQARRLKHSVSLFYLDIDHFKKINDSAGHPFGDLVLQEVARRIRAAVRESDTVARLGGDEFAVITGGETANPETSANLAKKMLDLMARPFLIDAREIHLTASIGVAFAPDDGNDVTTLVRNADIAMYQAKEKGRNNFQFFSPVMNMTLQERTMMENHLHSALDQKECQLVYQPIVDITSGTAVGMEALIRWHHPRQGLIPPSKFIPLAEENGLIIPLGEWILETACRQAQEWREQGFPSIRMAVNVSTLQLIQGDFPGFVEQTLRITGLPADCLELELTESVLLQKTDKVLSALSTFHAMGVRLSIDDFGTGYSSLSYLTHFHANTVKIDGSFVQGIGTHRGNNAVITTILALGEAMSLDVVAEGVETLEQAKFLKEHQCHLIQGYLLSMPVAARQIPEILKKNFLGNTGILSGI